ncbi:hypothetical protein H696_06329, partial [Fonticula alba]
MFNSSSIVCSGHTRPVVALAFSDILTELPGQDSASAGSDISQPSFKDAEYGLITASK